MNRPSAVILLAAGLGNRLRPLTESLPKALVSCGGWPLLAYDLEFARRALGPDGRLVVVTGHHRDLVEDYLAEAAPEAVTVHNPDFEKANILSVAAGLRAVDGDFLLMNVDHIYPLAFADRLVQSEGGVVCAVDHDRVLGPDDMKVGLDARGRVARISKRLETWDLGYIGMTLVRPEGLADWRRCFDRLLAARPDTAVAEEVIQALADEGHPAEVCDLSGLAWLEVDTLEDLESAEDRLAECPDLIHRQWNAGE